MFKKIGYGLGGFLILSSCMGFLNRNEKATAAEDAETMATVTKVEAKQLQHVTGVKLGKVQYHFEYEFKAEDGSKYSDRARVSEAQARGLSEGQTVTVVYDKQMPSFSAPIAYKEFVRAERRDKMRATKSDRIMIATSCLVVGVLLCVGMYFCKEEGEDVNQDWSGNSRPSMV